MRSPVDGSTTKKIIYHETSLASLSIGARKDLTDRQWRILEPLLPKGKRPGRPPKWSRRQLLDGVRWRVRVGKPIAYTQALINDEILRFSVVRTYTNS